MDGGEVATFGRPLYEQLRPVGTVDHILWGVALVVPEHPDLVAPEEGELVTSTGVRQPRAQMLLLLERFDMRWFVLFIDTSLTAIAIDIHQFVNGKGVLLIQRNIVEVFDGGDGLLGGLVLDESKTVVPRIQYQYLSCSISAVDQNTHPSDMFLSLSGIKTASSEVWPTELSFLSKNLMSFCLLSSGTTGSLSMTTKVSKLSSSFTSYCALRSGGKKRSR